MVTGDSDATGLTVCVIVGRGVVVVETEGLPEVEGFELTDADGDGFVHGGRLRGR